MRINVQTRKYMDMYNSWFVNSTTELRLLSVFNVLYVLLYIIYYYFSIIIIVIYISFLIKLKYLNFIKIHDLIINCQMRRTITTYNSLLQHYTRTY